MTDRPLRATISQKAALFGPDGDVLLLRDDADEVWELPGGRIAHDEAVAEGLCREIREETGLSARVGDPVYTAAWRNDDGEGRFAVVYRCRTESREVRLSHEHDDWAWVAPEDAAAEHLGSSVHQRALERLLAERPREAEDAPTSPDSNQDPNTEPDAEGDTSAGESTAPSDTVGDAGEREVPDR